MLQDLHRLYPNGCTSLELMDYENVYLISLFISNKNIRKIFTFTNLGSKNWSTIKAKLPQYTSTNCQSCRVGTFNYFRRLHLCVASMSQLRFVSSSNESLQTFKFIKSSFVNTQLFRLKSLPISKKAAKGYLTRCHTN